MLLAIEVVRSSRKGEIDPVPVSDDENSFSCLRYPPFREIYFFDTEGVSKSAELFGKSHDRIATTAGQNSLDIFEKEPGWL